MYMLIPAGRQLLKPCLLLGVWPWASYLMFLSLDFLIIEMAVRMQRVWYVGLELGAAWPQWTQHWVQEALGKDFCPRNNTPHI